MSIKKKLKEIEEMKVRAEHLSLRAEIIESRLRIKKGQEEEILIAAKEKSKN